MSQTPPPQELARKAIGGLFLGCLFELILYGIFALQFGSYWKTSHKDSLVIKCIVVWMFVLGTASAGIAIYIPYYYGVLNFGAVAELNHNTPANLSAILMLGLAAQTAQSFFGYRIRKLTGKTWIAVIIWALAVAQLGVLLTNVVTGIEAQLFSKISGIGKTVAWTVLAFVNDVFISVTLVTYLYRIKTGFTDTDSILTELIRLSVQTATITVVFLVAGTITFAFSIIHHDSYFLMIHVPLTIIYLICVMSSLDPYSNFQSSLEREHPSHSGDSIRKV